MNDSVKFRCQKCGIKIEADGTYKGSVAECPVCGIMVIFPEQGVSAGMLIDDFELQAPLGSGILGEVWLANQISMKRPVAIKIISPAIAVNPRAMALFIEDVKNVGKLSHPSIAPAIKAGSKGEIYYLAYEYIKGKSLAEIMAEGKLIEESEILKYAERIAEALMYAWNKYKILHRDLSPDHIIIDSHGRPMIIDMGISKAIAEDTTVTRTGLIMGSPPFMSPELVKGKKDIDSRADIFALGAIIYSMSTGVSPYVNVPPARLFMMQLKEPFPKVRDKNPKASERLARLVEIMTATRRTYRQHSWEDVILDIHQVMEGKMPETPQPPLPSNNQTDKLGSMPRIKRAVYPKRARLEKDNKARLLEIYSKSHKGKSPFYLIILIFIILSIAGAFLFFHYKTYGEENQRVEREYRVMEKLLDLSAKRKKKLLDEKGNVSTFEARKAFESSLTKAASIVKKDGSYGKAIALLEKARVEQALCPDGAGIGYTAGIDKEILRLKYERDKMIDNVVQSLDKTAEKLDAQGKYAEAAAVFDKYAGPVALESAGIRSVHAMKYKVKERVHRKFEALNKTSAQLPAANPDNEKLLRSAAINLFDGGLDEAIDALKKVKGQDVGNLIRAVENIRNRNDIIVKSFADDKDKKIFLLVNGETKELTVKDVKEERLFLEEEIESGVKLVFPVPFKDISTDEKISRISKHDALSGELYKGIIDAMRNNYGEASISFSGMGPLAPFLHEVINSQRVKYNSSKEP